MSHKIITLPFIAISLVVLGFNAQAKNQSPLQNFLHSKTGLEWRTAKHGDKFSTCYITLTVLAKTNKLASKKLNKAFTINDPNHKKAAQASAFLVQQLDIFFAPHDDPRTDLILSSIQVGTALKTILQNMKWLK